VTYVEIEGRLYEFTVLSEAGTDDIVVECCDMTPGGPGLVGEIRIAPTGSGSISLRRDIPAAVMRHWLDIAEREAGLVA
jgi:hypothetical protein